LIKHRNGYLVLACLSLLLNILLIVFLFCMMGRERIVVVPTEVNRSFWVTSSRVSPDYLAEMALYYTFLHFNVTPSNVSQQHALLLRYVAPASFNRFKMQLLTMEEKLKKDSISMNFQPTTYPEVDSNRLIAKVTGDVQYRIGDIQLPPQSVVYQWQFHY